MLGDSRFTKFGHAGLRLESKESIVKLLVIDIDLSHLRLNSFSSLLSKGLICLFGFYCISLFPNTGFRDPSCFPHQYVMKGAYEGETYEVRDKVFSRYLSFQLGNLVLHSSELVRERY